MYIYNSALDAGLQIDAKVLQVKLIFISELHHSLCYRNLSADVTRFLPTALRVKREDKKKKDAKNTSVSGELIHVYIYICKMKVKWFLC
jgi:hypothetical protein